jgi:hypothetical protein
LSKLFLVFSSCSVAACQRGSVLQPPGRFLARWLHPELGCTTAAAGHHAVTVSSPAPLYSNLSSAGFRSLLATSYSPLRTRNLLREHWRRSTSFHLCASQHTDGVRSICAPLSTSASCPIGDSMNQLQEYRTHPSELANYTLNLICLLSRSASFHALRSRSFSWLTTYDTSASSSRFLRMMSSRS